MRSKEGFSLSIYSVCVTKPCSLYYSGLVFRPGIQIVRLLPIKPATNPILQPYTVPTQYIYRDSANFYQILLMYFASIRNILKAYLYKQVANTLQVSYRLLTCRQTYRQSSRANYNTTANFMLQPYSIPAQVQSQVIYMQADTWAVGQS